MRLAQHLGLRRHWWGNIWTDSTYIFEIVWTTTLYWNKVGVYIGEKNTNDTSQARNDLNLAGSSSTTMAFTGADRTIPTHHTFH